MLYENLAIIWLDAHPDINIPNESPSKTLAGIALRTLIGEGDDLIIQKLFKKINHKQIFLMGVRDIDQKEKQYIDQYNIYNSLYVNESNMQNLINLIKLYNFNNVYIHIDLDVLDIKDFNSVKCSIPNGVSFDEIIKCIKILKANFNIVGSSILEFTENINDDEINKLKKIFPINNNLCI